MGTTTRQQDEQQDAVKEILGGARVKPTLPDLSGKRTFEIHLHISGPIVIGTEVASTLLPILLKTINRANSVQDK